MAILDERYKVNEPYFNGRSYVEWLESFTIDERVEPSRRLRYSRLLKTLWDTEFVPSIGNDDDRAIEGRQLRTRYNDILAKKAGRGKFSTPDVQDIFGECRVLEMLIALAMHMYDFMQDLGLYNSVSRWFWEIMQNVGFDRLDDSEWGREGTQRYADTEHYVKDICYEIMEGDGALRGRNGGWFGIEEWEKLEIWYQMHRFLKRYMMGY